MGHGLLGLQGHSLCLVCTYQPRDPPGPPPPPHTHQRPPRVLTIPPSIRPPAAGSSWTRSAPSPGSRAPGKPGPWEETPEQRRPPRTTTPTAKAAPLDASCRSAGTGTASRPPHFEEELPQLPSWEGRGESGSPTAAPRGETPERSLSAPLASSSVSNVSAMCGETEW